MSKRLIIQVLWLGLGLYACFALSKSLWQLYQAGQRVTTEEEKLEGLNLQVNELRKRLEFVNSYQFIEQQARDKLNLQRPGELVLVPPQVNGLASDSETKQATELSNWQKWLKLFL